MTDSDIYLQACDNVAGTEYGKPYCWLSDTQCLSLGLLIAQEFSRLKLLSQNQTHGTNHFHFD